MTTPCSDVAPKDLFDRVAELSRALRAALQVETTDVLCVLGSGLGGAVDALDDRRSVPTGELPHLPRSTVEGHQGILHSGRVGATRVLALQGRVHTYEGVPPWQSTLLVRAAARLGAKVAVLTNSAGAANPDYEPGNLMLLSDHLNLSGRNPLVGPHDPRLGPRFPDLTHTYDRALRRLARRAAVTVGATLREGIYAWLLGPTYETPAEVRMAQRLGADAVGMSTVPEAIVARQMGLKVLAISCITNLGAGLSATALTHEEVQEVAGPAAKKLGALLVEVLPHVA